MVETNKPTRVAIGGFKDLLVNRNHKRLAKPAPSRPIKGDISIAPIITAVELTFNPMDYDNSAS
jgi:hypothetical protein